MAVQPGGMTVVEIFLQHNRGAGEGFADRQQMAAVERSFEWAQFAVDAKDALPGFDPRLRQRRTSRCGQLGDLRQLA